MPVRAVIFDLGHTLWDILPDRGGLARAYDDMRAVLVERLGRDDLPEARAFQRAVAAVLRAANETYFADAGHLEQPPSHVWVEEACRGLGLKLDDRLLREITPPLFATELDRLECRQGTLEALRELHDAGYRLGCVTNTLADTATIRAMLRLYGFEELMSAVVVSADAGWRKPHPSLFEAALRQAGVPASEAAFVGDSPVHDIGGARATGMRAILTRQYVTRPTEGLPEADAVIDDVRELRGVIERWP